MPLKPHPTHPDKIMYESGKYVLPKREWVGLTDEDRYEFAAATYSWEELLIAAETKLKEKNYDLPN